jgi:hypothetical protein
LSFFFLQLDEEEGDVPQEEHPDMAKGRISEMIEQQSNDVKEKIEGVKVSLKINGINKKNELYF